MGASGAPRRTPWIPAADRPAWEQQPNETPKAYHGFRTYLGMGSKRTVRGVIGPLKLTSFYMTEKWSIAHGWQERAAVWDADQCRIEKEARDSLIRDRAKEAAEIQWQEGAANRELAEKMREKARDMLNRVDFDGQIEERTDSKTGKKRKVRVNKTKWNMATIAKFADFASKIGMVAITEMVAHMSEEGFDPATASPDECRAFLVKHGAGGVSGGGGKAG